MLGDKRCPVFSNGGITGIIKFISEMCGFYIDDLKFFLLGINKILKE